MCAILNVEFNATISNYYIKCFISIKRKHVLTLYNPSYTIKIIITFYIISIIIIIIWYKNSRTSLKYIHISTMALDFWQPIKSWVSNIKITKKDPGYGKMERNVTKKENFTNFCTAYNKDRTKISNSLPKKDL